MNVKVYTQQSTIFSNNPLSLLKNGGESLLLSVVAIIGLVGTVYVLSNNSNATPPSEMSQFAIMEVAESMKSDFDKYVSIDGDKKVGSELTFEVNLDLKAKRYVMEMGDGRRMILTQPNFTYRYDAAGQYLLELKELQRGLIVLVGDKKLKIKN